MQSLTRAQFSDTCRNDDQLYETCTLYVGSADLHNEFNNYLLIVHHLVIGFKKSMVLAMEGTSTPYDLQVRFWSGSRDNLLDNFDVRATVQLSSESTAIQGIKIFALLQVHCHIKISLIQTIGMLLHLLMLLRYKLDFVIQHFLQM